MKHHKRKPLHQHVQVGYTGIRRAPDELIEAAARVSSIDELREARLAEVRRENERFLRGEK